MSIPKYCINDTTLYHVDTDTDTDTDTSGLYCQLKNCGTPWSSPLNNSSAFAALSSTALLNLFINGTPRFIEVFFDDSTSNKENLFLQIFSVIGNFCINNLSLMNALTCFSPVGRTCFNWSDTDGGKERELFRALKESISKGLHGIAQYTDSTSLLNFVLNFSLFSWCFKALMDESLSSKESSNYATILATSGLPIVSVQNHLVCSEDSMHLQVI